MGQRAKFAYAQARIQARHGDRLDAAGWRRLARAGDFLQLLQIARAGALRPWVAPFNKDTDVHVMELWLRQQFRQYVHGVASWQPAPWREALRWTCRLGDLPALRHLVSGHSVLPWMRRDEALASFTAGETPARMAAMRASDCAPMVKALDRGGRLVDGWLGHWRGLWPGGSRRVIAPLERLTVLLRRQFDMSAEMNDARRAAHHREKLRHALEAGFRRFTQQPATAYFHLGLIVDDLVALRGELVRHRVFERGQRAVE